MSLLLSPSHPPAFNTIPYRSTVISSTPSLKMATTRTGTHDDEQQQRKPTAAASHNAWRPVDYDTHRRIDQFFGETPLQRRERYLHVKDASGKWWFDEQERDENRLLLDPLSPLTPMPSTPVTMSRTATTLGYSSAPESPTATPTRSRQYRRRSSSHLVTCLKPLEVVSPSSSMAPYYQWDLLRRGSSGGEADRGLSGLNIFAPPPGETSVRPRAKRSHSVVERLNLIPDRMPGTTVAAFGGQTHDADPQQQQRDSGYDGDTDADVDLIRLPAYLPLPHRKLPEKEIADAFAPPPGSAPRSDRVPPLQQQRRRSVGFVDLHPVAQSHGAVRSSSSRRHHRPAKLDLSLPGVGGSNFKRSSILLATRNAAASPCSPRGNFDEDDGREVFQTQQQQTIAVAVGDRCDEAEGSPEWLRTPSLRGAGGDGQQMAAAAQSPQSPRSSPSPSLSSPSSPRSSISDRGTAARATTPRSLLSMATTRAAGAGAGGSARRSPTLLRRPWSSHDVSPTKPPPGGVALLTARRRSSLIVSPTSIGMALASSSSPTPFSDLAAPEPVSPHLAPTRAEKKRRAAVTSADPFEGGEVKGADLERGESSTSSSSSASAPGKASHLLGLNPLNAHLLAPAGLPTGEAAYDRVGIIAGASRKLDSDDEGESEGRSSISSSRRARGAQQQHDEQQRRGAAGASEESSSLSVSGLARKRTTAAADGGKRAVKKFLRAFGTADARSIV